MESIATLVECMCCGKMGYLKFDETGEVTQVRFTCACPQLTAEEMNLLLNQVNNMIGRMYARARTSGPSEGCA